MHSLTTDDDEFIFPYAMASNDTKHHIKNYINSENKSHIKQEERVTLL